MSTDSPSGTILTATVAIFSPDMAEVIMVINDKLNRIVPPWGKYDPAKDTNVFHTALREVKEEIWRVLSPSLGVFLDKNWMPILDPVPVQYEPFTFINDPTKRGCDSLYFFRLHEKLGHDLRGEKSGFWLTKYQVLRKELEMGGQTYWVLFPRMQDAIERVMR